MPSTKRERKRQGRAERLAYLEAQRRKRKLRKQAIVIAVVVALIALLAAIFSGGGDDGDDEPAARQSAFGTTECPPADGAPTRTTKFDAPFKKCIVSGKDYKATIETDAGTIEWDLLEVESPLTVNNFVALARHQYYTDVPFHRVIPDFVVQGGDAETGTGSGGPGFQIKDELPKPEDYEAGSVAMANSGPNTNGSQFFIVVSEAGAKTLVQAVGGEAKYSLFAKVTSGMDVVKKIEADGDQSGKPKVVHKIVKVTITES